LWNWRVSSRTAIDRPTVGPDTGGVVLNLSCKHSRVKQYLKDLKAMRIETVINSPATWGATPACPTPPTCRTKPAPLTGAY
jgi:hypothetical protein